MASYRKRGKSWYAEVSRQGQRFSQTFDTKAEAAAWATQKEVELRTAGSSSPSLLGKNKTFYDVCREFEKTLLPKRKGKRWEKIRLDSFKEKISWAGQKLSEINSKNIANWKIARLEEVAPSTVNRELNFLSKLFEVARSEWNWISINPVRGVERPKNPPPRDRRISQEEQDKILAALKFEMGKPPKLMKQHLGAAFLFALETGMRKSEILALRWDKVFLEKRFLTIPESKNEDRRKVPLSTQAIELLKLQREAAKDEFCFPINSDSFCTTWREARDKVEIEDLTFHDTRHEATTRLARKLEILDLARMIGHRDLKSLMIYYNPTPEEIALRLG